MPSLYPETTKRRFPLASKEMLCLARRSGVVWVGDCTRLEQKSGLLPSVSRCLKAVMCGGEVQVVGSTRQAHDETTPTERGERGGGMEFGNLAAAEKQGTRVHPSQLEVNKQTNK